MLPKSPVTPVIYLTSDNSDSKAIYPFPFECEHKSEANLKKKKKANKGALDSSTSH